jgi:hypothetical protein
MPTDSYEIQHQVRIIPPRPAGFMMTAEWHPPPAGWHSSTTTWPRRSSIVGGSRPNSAG